MDSDTQAVELHDDMLHIFPSLGEHNATTLKRVLITLSVEEHILRLRPESLSVLQLVRLRQGVDGGDAWQYKIACVVPHNINDINACLICSNYTDSSIEFGTIQVEPGYRAHTAVKYTGVAQLIPLVVGGLCIELVWVMTRTPSRTAGAA